MEFPSWLTDRQREFLKARALLKEQRRLDSAWRKRLKALVARLYEERGGCCEMCKAPLPIEGLLIHYKNYLVAQRHETAEDISLLCKQCDRGLRQRLRKKALLDSDAPFVDPALVSAKRKSRKMRETEMMHFARQTAEKITQEKEHVTASDLASGMGVTPNTARSYVKRLIDEFGWEKHSVPAQGSPYRGGRRALAAKRRSPCSS